MAAADLAAAEQCARDSDGTVGVGRFIASA